MHAKSTGLAVSGLLLAVWAVTAGGGPERRADADDATDGPQESERPLDPVTGDAQRAFVGADGCARCHTQSIGNLAADPELGAFFPAGGVVDDSWVQLTELATWFKHDKHSQAYTSLLNERSQQIGRLMKLDHPVHRDKRCLACHTGVPLAQLEIDEATGHAAASTDTDRRVVLGVSCEGCHGPAGVAEPKSEEARNLQGWFTIHAQKAKWRFLDPREKLESYGYYDVRDPASAAAICASCHVGDVKQGRVLTHEMYAAGHPPLPGFEYQTFLDQMPPHWWDFEEKPEKVRNEYLAKTSYEHDPQVLTDTRRMLLGALVTARESTQLNHDLVAHEVVAGWGSAGMPVRGEWPELAQFECFACHHDLRHDGWRQQRGTELTPGRPLLREWPDALLEAVLQAVDAPEYAKKRLPLRQTLSRRPFGEDDEFQAASGDLADYLDQLVGEWREKPVDRETGRAIRRALAEKAAAETLDYDSARQIQWAFEVVDRELEGTRPETDEVARLAAENRRELILDLKAGRSVKQKIPGAGTREVKEVDLETVLPPIADYDPHGFQQRFAQVLEILDSDR